MPPQIKPLLSGNSRPILNFEFKRHFGLGQHAASWLMELPKGRKITSTRRGQYAKLNIRRSMPIELINLLVDIAIIAARSHHQWHVHFLLKGPWGISSKHPRYTRAVYGNPLEILDSRCIYKKSKWESISPIYWARDTLIEFSHNKLISKIQPVVTR